MRRILMGVAVAIVAALAGVLAGPAAANAEPPYSVTCYHYTCDGQSPYGTNCALDKQAIYTVRPDGDAWSSWLTLYYSPRCASAWAETNMWYRTVAVHSYDLWYNYRVTYSQYTNGTYQWSPMVYDGGLLAQAWVSAVMGGAGTYTGMY